MSDSRYEFDTLPLGGIPPGTTALVTSQSADRARRFALRLFADMGSRGTVLVTTSVRASDIVDEYRAAGLPVDRDRAIIIDCTGKRAWFSSARVERVSGPDNVGGIGFQFSKVSQELVAGDIRPVGVGIATLSELMTAATDLRTVNRFVNTTTGRIQRTAGVGALIVDPSAHDRRAIDTVAEFCDGRIELRHADGGSQLRTLDLPDQPEKWRPYQLPAE